MAQLDPVGWFRSAHPEQGSLRVQVSSGRELFPVPGAEVEVYRDFGGHTAAGAAGGLGMLRRHGGHQRHGVQRGGAPSPIRRG